MSTSPSTCVMRSAPATAPSIPGSSRRRNSRRFTLPNFTCEIPEKPVVKTSAMCTLALASAGLAPVLRRKVVAVMP